MGEWGWLAYLCFFLVFVCFIFPPLAFAPGKTNRLHYLPSCYSPLGVSARSVALRQPRANRLRRGVLVLRSLYFMLKSADLFAKICQSEFSGRYDTFCNTQKRNITILSAKKGLL